MEIAKQCTEIILHDKSETETLLLWKALFIQATKHENVFFEEMLSNIAYSLLLSTFLIIKLKKEKSLM